MPEPKYVGCQNCGGQGEVPEQDPETLKWVDRVCPVCNGDGEILDEQIPDENE